MTEKTFSQVCQATQRSIQGERLAREKVGADWLADLERQFADEFPASKPPIESIAQRAVEANVAADRKQVARPGRVE